MGRVPSGRVPVVVMGLGHIGKEICRAALASEEVDLVGAVDNAPALQGASLKDVLGAASTLRISPTLGTQPRGAVLLRPWETYRRPAWNHGEAVFDPWSKLLSRPVIWNDGTRVGHVGLAPDDPRARRLDGAIRGGGPLTAALRRRI